MTLYDIQTVYLVIGFLYVILPATAWMVLSEQRSMPAALWCGGGLMFSVSCFLFALRGNLPDWLTYSAANYLLWMANLLPVIALREQLQQPRRSLALLAAFAVMVLVFEYLNLIANDHVLRFQWSMFILIGLFAYIHQLALAMARTQHSRSASWLSAVYFIAAGIIFIRYLRVALGHAPAGATVSGIDSMLTVCAGLVTSVLGNFAFVGTYLERASKQSMQAAVARAKQEEALRLGAQIAHLDRQRALGTMAAAFAHELSQPLTAILVDTQNAKVALPTDAKNACDLEQALNDIQNSSERAVGLLMRIRNFIKPTLTDHKRIDLQTLTREVIDLMDSQGRSIGVQIQIDLGDTPAWVWGDRIEISQIMVNVLRNAFEAMQNGPERVVTIRLTLTQERCILQFTDTGTGIPPELIDPVGTPFVTSKPEGLGVGFSISRTIAQKHGGSLIIANMPSGGACVTLELPKS
jgi:C4-dicarboxylate-specific signal transduction histidine kinase